MNLIDKLLINRRKKEKSEKGYGKEKQLNSLSYFLEIDSRFCFDKDLYNQYESGIKDAMREVLDALAPKNEFSFEMKNSFKKKMEFSDPGWGGLTHYYQTEQLFQLNRIELYNLIKYSHATAVFPYSIKTSIYFNQEESTPIEEEIESYYDQVYGIIPKSEVKNI